MAGIKETVKEAKIGLGFVYKSLYLSCGRKDEISKNPSINIYQDTAFGSGKSIKNARAYRRRGGETHVTERHMFAWEKAWIALQERAGDIASFMYKNKMPSAKAVFAFSKQRQNLSKRTLADRTFIKRSCQNALEDVTQAIIKEKLGQEVEVKAYGSNLEIRTDSKSFSLDSGITKDEYADPKKMLQEVYKNLT